MSFRIGIARTAALAFSLALGGLFAAAAAAQAGEGKNHIRGWQLERDVDPPSFSVTEPLSTDLNVDTVVLACGEFGGAGALQFEIYLTEAGGLRPKVGDAAMFAPEKFKSEPMAQIEVDGRVFAARLYFSEDFLIVTDVVVDRLPALSRSLLNALENGQTMIMRFDLLDRPHTGATASDGYVTVDLGQGGATAVSAVRRCAEPNGRRVSHNEELIRLDRPNRF